MKPISFQKQVLSWFEKHGRKHLPWQQNITPYKVWLSEIMLQQTQVKTVIPYFKTFIHHFPTIDKLAAAPIDNILHLWTGLGYYARARNLHKCATVIRDNYNSKFPDNVEELTQLPGIGRSTAGAIISLSMNKAAAILDGNVKRVLARCFCIEGYPGEAKTQKYLWQLAENYTPVKQTAKYTQAMMDLGAMVCTRTKPTCDSCPLQKHCQAYAQKRITEFPYKKIKKDLPIRSTNLIIIKNDKNELFLTQRPPAGIWGGLWSFPECQKANQIDKIAKQQFGFNIKSKQTLKPFRHTFSHYHLDITPILVTVSFNKQQIMEKQPAIWYKNQKVGLPQPIKKLIRLLSKPSILPEL